MLAWLGEGLARAGYVVAAVNHHGNTSAEPMPTPEGFMLWWERATDLSRVVDRLAADRQFAESIDWNRIGAAGFSLGGYTAVAVAGGRTSLERWASFCESAGRDSTCTAQPEFPEALVEFENIRDRADVQGSIARHGDSYRDTRFRAVLAIAPVGSWLTDESLGTIDVPVRIIVGTHDTTAPAANNASRMAQLIPGAELSVLQGVGHYTFLAACESAGARDRPLLCHEEPGVDRADVHRRVAVEAVAFFGDILGVK
jgi:predicted dienelactone hydrolase